MTPEEADLLQARLKDPAAAAADDRTLGQRIMENGQRLAPLLGAALAGPGGLTLKPLGELGAGHAMALSGGPAPGERAIKSFERDPEPVTSPGGLTLRPMSTPEPTVNAAPTLDPRYGQTMVPQRLGGGPGFGGLQGSLDAARKRQDDLIGEEASNARQLGVDQAGRTIAVSDLEAEEAARQQAAAERQAKVDADAQGRLQSFLKRQEDMTDELGKMKVDSRRLFRSADAGTQFSMWAGAILGGMLGAEHGGGNSSLDRLDKIIDRDIKVQQDEIDNKKAQIGARNSLFGQMLSEVGDSRVAAAAVRNQMLEAAKLSLKSKADALGVPEIRTKAEIAANAIEQKQQGLRVQISEGALRAAQAAAAAAASAREKAERDAREWALKVAELGLKKDELSIKAMDAGKDKSGKDDAAVAKATERLADDDIVNNAGVIESLQRRIRPDGSIVGFDTGAKVRSALGRVAMADWKGGASDKYALTDDERKAQQEWNQMGLVFKNLKTGSGASEKEAEIIKQALEGRGTQEERRNAIRLMGDILKRRQGYAKGSLTDDQRKELDRREAREGLTPMPDTVRAK